MKVLLTATVQSHIVQFHKQLVEILHEYGCEVHVAACDNLNEKNGLSIDFVDCVFDVPFVRSPMSKDNFKAYKMLKQIIDNEDYDVIHCNTPMGGIVTRLAARKKRNTGTKVYYTAHGFHFYKGAPIINWVLFYPIEKIFSKITDKIITINEEDYLLARNRFYCKVEHIHGVGVDEKKFYSASNAEKSTIRSKLNIPKNDRIILCVGELLPNKNQEMAILSLKHIINKCPDTKLYFAGNGPDKDRLQKIIKDNQLEKYVHWLGYVTNMHEYQKIVDIAVSCSIREGLGLNIIEAMMSGTPVVVSKNRGHCELIYNGFNGFLIEVDDCESMGNKFLELLNNKSLYENIQINALKSVKPYGSKNVKIELMKIYEIACE